MTFVFWGLFVVLGLIALGYWRWMVWVEQSEPGASREASRETSGGPSAGGAAEREDEP